MPAGERRRLNERTKTAPLSPSHGSMSSAKLRSVALGRKLPVYEHRRLLALGVVIPATPARSSTIASERSPSGRTRPPCTAARRAERAGQARRLALVRSHDPDRRGASQCEHDDTDRLRAAEHERGMLAAAPLLDRDRLREVPGLVHVQALHAGHVVGQELERKDRDDRLEDPVGAGHLDRQVGGLARLGGALGRDRDRRRRPGRRTSSMLESIFSSVGLSVATHTTGVDSSSRAIGPCFISPAA